MMTNPQHIGIIMDGNRRWADASGKTYAQGYKTGYKALKAVLESIREKEIKFVSIYAFSSENWSRDEKEIALLMNLARWAVKNELDELDQEGVRLMIIGSAAKIDSKLYKLLKSAEVKTKANQKGTLVVCFNYGGQQEIADAVKEIVKLGFKEAEITPELIEQHLYGGTDVPPVDLIIRTSGEKRLSNFMLWRAAYAEFVFVDKNWPDFAPQDLDLALKEYASRQRRFGV